MKLKAKLVMVLAVAISIVAVGVSSAEAASTGWYHYYQDELTVSNSIESHGFVYHGRHIAVDNAFCTGLRRYGVESSEFGLDKFWRFNCDADAANGHFYTLHVSTTHGPKAGYWYLHVLSSSLSF